MAKKIIDDETGEEIEVYTADELKAQLEAKDAEFGTVKTALETELAGAKTALGERAGEFKQFRELHKDVVEKLGVAERVIYENQKVQHEEKVAREAEEKKSIDANVDATIRSKAGTDEKLFAEMKKMYDLVGIVARTPEEIERKTLIVLGAIGQAQPDLVASVQGFSGGSYVPPTKTTTEPTFGETDAGKGLAGDLGLQLEPKK